MLTKEGVQRQVEWIVGHCLYNLSHIFSYTTTEQHGLQFYYLAILSLTQSLCSLTSQGNESIQQHIRIVMVSDRKHKLHACKLLSFVTQK